MLEEIVMNPLSWVIVVVWVVAAGQTLYNAAKEDEHE